LRQPRRCSGRRKSAKRNKVQTYLEPTRESGRALLMRGIPGEVVMLNLLRLRDVADYAANPELAPEQPGAVISSADARDSRPPRKMNCSFAPPESESSGSGLFGPKQFQGARVRFAVVELLQGLRE
jgi:hypothetical protein